ncbi:MAG: hypothetical protein HYU36_03420 [Planctomycetes bacterium]|nr:hypothetical protein [Planctomycetota bacterium]
MRRTDGPFPAAQEAARLLPRSGPTHRGLPRWGLTRRGLTPWDAAGMNDWLAVVLLLSLGSAGRAETRSLEILGEAQITDYSVQYHLRFEKTLPVEIGAVDVADKFPFAWCKKAGKTLQLDEKGLEARAEEVFQRYKKVMGDSATMEKLMNSGLRDDALLEVRSVMDVLERGGEMDDDQLLEAVKAEYRTAAGIFLAKMEGQKSIANPYKMPASYYDRVQPWIAALMYGNRYMALAELYRSARVFEGNRDRYLSIYLNETIIRRTARINTRLQDMSVNLADLDRQELGDIISVSVATMVGKQMYRLNDDEKVLEKKKL